MGGCCSSAKDPVFTVTKNSEAEKDAAATALQLAAAEHLRRKEAAAESKMTDAERKAADAREAEAAKLLQRAAAAHLALAEPAKPPSLSIPASSEPSNVMSGVMESARGLVDGLASAFRGDAQASGAAQPGASPLALNVGPAQQAQSDGNIFDAALNSARAVIQNVQSGFGGGGAEDLAAQLEAQQPPVDDAEPPPVARRGAPEPEPAEPAAQPAAGGAAAHAAAPGTTTQTL